MRDKTSGTVAIEREGKIYTGSYTIARKMITVAYGSRAKTTQLGGSADAPAALARIMLGEILKEEVKEEPAAAHSLSSSATICQST